MRSITIITVQKTVKDTVICCTLWKAEEALLETTCLSRLQ